MSASYWNGKLVDDFDVFLFDCDGVLWRGLETISGAVESLEQLRKKGKKVLFISNNSSQSRNGYLKKFKKFGIQASKDEIYSSSYAAACFLKNAGVKGKVFVIGEHGLCEELEENEFDVIHASKKFGGSHLSREEMENMELEDGIQALVAGMDMEFTHTKLAYASFILHEIPDCLFISTNQDQTFPSTRRIFPGSGSIISALATGGMKSPINVGKPTSVLLDVIAQEFGLEGKRERILMVGDRLNTDIQFGKNGGLKTLLVLTGITKEDEVFHPENSIVPDFVLDSVKNLHCD